ncbi:hypothetical protein PGT21_024272 [Puccinia graminis f. sp. tritici]|uniref:Catalase core domain-containing protein n=1 Tax=Puccinia graminis f. sp. tritici TaxID=56615 RepID=A0A5B0QKU1_PUCGR|nr:hypothetical protein PGT21_024272 [Puccinia graminis f. sp. tritici]KAA1113759.1 hypothetical protein PGTUg99_016205 [Puccinia graminis f. sp. tritici]
MKANLTLAVVSFFNTLISVELEALWLDHLVVLERESPDQPFFHPGHQKAHTVGKNDFYTRIQVDPDGQIWANNPFPFGCWYKITQDSQPAWIKHQRTQFATDYFRKSKPLGRFVARLNQTTGLKISIRMSYYLNQEQVEKLDRLEVGPSESAFIRPKPQRSCPDPTASSTQIETKYD